MKFLQEVLTGFSKLDNQQDVQQDNSSASTDQFDDQDQGTNQDDSQENPDQPNDQLDQVADQASEDPDRQGMIRTVKGAHLVYKRQSEDGGYEELWIYNVTDMRKQQEIKRNILSGTDIPVNRTTSPDGSQSYKLWSAGNAELLSVTGLQS